MKYIYINIAFAQFQRFVYGVRPNHLYANHLFLHFLADAWFNPDRLNPKGKRCVSVCVYFLNISGVCRSMYCKLMLFIVITLFFVYFLKV